jgi:hypothetical protein
VRVLLYLSSAVLVVVFATWTYRVNYATQEALSRVGELRATVAREREAIAVLEAEWAYLNRPDRLRALVGLHADALQLAPLDPGQFAEAAMVAFPPEEESPLPAGGEAR